MRKMMRIRCFSLIRRVNNSLLCKVVHSSYPWYIEAATPRIIDTENPFSNVNTGFSAKFLSLAELNRRTMACTGQHVSHKKGKIEMYSPFCVLFLGILLWTWIDLSSKNLISVHMSVSNVLKLFSYFDNNSPNLKILSYLRKTGLYLM